MLIKSCHSCLDILTGNQQAQTELKWKYRQSSSGNISTLSFAVWLSSHSTCGKSLIEDCGGSSHTSVDRAGSIKIETFTSLILCMSNVNSALVHARYKYQCSHQDLQAKGHE